MLILEFDRFFFSEKLLPFFLNHIECGTEEIRSMCSSALLALVYNSQKVISISLFLTMFGVATHRENREHGCSFFHTGQTK